MSRIDAPDSSASWNQYINAQVAELGDDPDPAEVQLLKRDIKIGEYAAVIRSQLDTPSYRDLNEYNSPGTVSPAVGRPWTTP